MRSRIFKKETLIKRRILLFDYSIFLVSRKSSEQSRVNQDCAVVIPHKNGNFLVGVADGVGSGLYGDAASFLFVKELSRYIRNQKNFSLSVVLKGFKCANKSLLKNYPSDATTFAGLLFSNNLFWAINIGDSEVGISSCKNGRLAFDVSTHHSKEGFIQLAEIDDESDDYLLNYFGSINPKIELLMPVDRRDFNFGYVMSDGFFSYSDRNVLHNGSNNMVKKAFEGIADLDRDAQNYYDDFTGIIISKNKN